MIIAKTERLILREFTEDDAAFIYTLLNTPSWLRFIGDRGINNLDDAKAYLSNSPLKSYAENGFGGWLTELKTGGEPIGMCGLFKRPFLAVPDIGFALLPAFEGKGYAVEAVAATLITAREKLGLEKVFAITQDDNAASIKLLERTGFIFKQMLKPPGEEHELRLYSINLKQ